jgi:hypothetical protein
MSGSKPLWKWNLMIHTGHVVFQNNEIEETDGLGMWLGRWR